MTSKEKCIRLYSDFDETEDRGYSVYDYFKDIEKDLEILEILKKWFMEHIINYLKYDNSLFIDTFIREDEPIFEILKQWLEGESK